MWPANSHCFNRVRVGGCVCGTHSALEGTSLDSPFEQAPLIYLFITDNYPIFLYFILFFSTITLGTHLKLSVSVGFLPLTGSCFPRFFFVFFFSCAH